MSDEFMMIRYEVEDGEKTISDLLIVPIHLSRGTDLELIDMMYGLDAFDEDDSHDMVEEYEKNGYIMTSWGLVKVTGRKPMTLETKELFNSYGVY